MEDHECSKLREYCVTHRPRISSIESSLKPYWKVRGSLTLCDGLLLYNSSIVVPPSLRREILSKIHEGHWGVERCRIRVRCSVWWPGVSSEVKQFVENCCTCAREPARNESPPEMRAPPTYTAPRIFMADGGNRPLWAWKEAASVGSRLLLSIPRMLFNSNPPHPIQSSLSWNRFLLHMVFLNLSGVTMVLSTLLKSLQTSLRTMDLNILQVAPISHRVTGKLKGWSKLWNPSWSSHQIHT